MWDVFFFLNNTLRRFSLNNVDFDICDRRYYLTVCYYEADAT